MFMLESPWPILFLGIAVEAVLATMLAQTRRGFLLWVMLGAAILTGAALAVERYVVTDREAVENVIDEAAAAILDENLERLLNCIAPSSEHVRADARFVFGRVRVQSLYLRDMVVEVDRGQEPPTAKVRFRALGQGNDRGGEFPYQAFNRHVRVDFRLEGDRWRIIDYEVEGLNEYLSR